MQYEFREIDQWPGKLTANRRRAPFAASHLSTLKLLERELKHLQARSVVIQAAVSSQDIRNDGMLRSTARPRHPGIILSFETATLGPLSYPCDTFDDWTQNLRAIALALEALRRVERYGVTRRGEQYRGWAKLPAPGFMGEKEAEIIVLQSLGLQPESQSIERDSRFSKATYPVTRRAALRNSHPDTGGSADKYKKVIQALTILDKVYL